MAVVRKSITFTPQMNEWMQSLVAKGEYANESEYLRDLIRHHQEAKSQRLVLERALKEGLESGVSKKSLEDIWTAAEEMQGYGKEPT